MTTATLHQGVRTQPVVSRSDNDVAGGDIAVTQDTVGRSSANLGKVSSPGVCAEGSAATAAVPATRADERDLRSNNYMHLTRAAAHQGLDPL